MARSDELVAAAASTDGGPRVVVALDLLVHRGNEPFEVELKTGAVLERDRVEPDSEMNSDARVVAGRNRDLDRVGGALEGGLHERLVVRSGCDLAAHVDLDLGRGALVGVAGAHTRHLPFLRVVRPERSLAPKGTHLKPVGEELKTIIYYLCLYVNR